MEINITKLMTQDTKRYQDSIASSGLQNIGDITWNNALNDSDAFVFVTNDNRDSFISFFSGFGAWDDLETWDNQQLNALFLQFVAGEIEEFNDIAQGDWKEYYKLCEEGIVAGYLFENENKVYFALN